MLYGEENEFSSVPHCIFCPSPVIWQTFIRVLVDRLLLGKVGKGIHTPCVQNGGFD